MCGKCRSLTVTAAVHAAIARTAPFAGISAEKWSIRGVILSVYYVAI